MAGFQRPQFPKRRTPTDYPGVGHCEQPARLQRRQPDIRRLARYAAVPRSQRVHAGGESSATTGATVRPGNQNSSDVRGPGRRRVDLTLTKTFTLRGTSQIQFRFESFNVFNWRQLNNPSYQRYGGDVRADYERGIDENGADRAAVDVLILEKCSRRVGE